MATCNLNKYENYNLDNVKHDLSEKQFIVKLSRPPHDCKEGVFTSHAAALKVDTNLAAPILSYDGVNNRPVILVPNENLVQDVNVPQGHFWAITLGLAAVVALGFLVRWFLSKEEDQDSSYSGVTSGRFSSTTPNQSNGPKSDWSEVSEPETPRAAAPKAHRAATPPPSPTHHEPSIQVQQTILTGGVGSTADVLSGVALGSILGSASRNDDYEERQNLRRRERRLEEQEDELRRERRQTELREEQSLQVAEEEEEDEEKSSSSYSSDDSSSISGDSSDSYSSDSSSDSFSSDSGSDSFSSD